MKTCKSGWKAALRTELQLLFFNIRNKNVWPEVKRAIQWVPLVLCTIIRRAIEKIAKESHFRLFSARFNWSRYFRVRSFARSRDLKNCANTLSFHLIFRVNSAVFYSFLFLHLWRASGHKTHQIKSIINCFRFGQKSVTAPISVIQWKQLSLEKHDHGGHGHGHGWDQCAKHLVSRESHCTLFLRIVASKRPSLPLMR